MEKPEITKQEKETKIEPIIINSLIMAFLTAFVAYVHKKFRRIIIISGIAGTILIAIIDWILKNPTLP